VALGVLKPTILIPARFAADSSIQTLDSILIHELAHHYRADCAWQFIQRVVEAGLWFHPLIWISRRRIAFIRERACDDFAVDSIGDFGAYAETLLNVAAAVTRRRSLGLGLAAVRSSKLSARLAAICRGARNRHCNASLITRIVLVGGAILCVSLVATLAVQRPLVPASDAPIDCRLRVVDEHDNPVARFEAMTYSADKLNTIWWPGSAGSVTIYKSTSPVANQITVLVRAEGYASTITQFTGEQCDQLRRGEAKIVMRQGQNVEVQFHLPDGLAWPVDVLPEVYLEDFRNDIWRSKYSWVNRRAYSPHSPDYNMFNIRPSQSERFALRLAPESNEFYVGICAPGFLQQFEAGPFSLTDVKDGVLRIEVPRPATLDVTFDPDGDAGALPFGKFSLNILAQIPGQRSEYVAVASEEGGSQRSELHLTDLGPGVYQVSVRTIPKPTVKNLADSTLNPGAYHDIRTIALRAGQSERFDFRFTPVDPNVFRGSRTAVIRILTCDGVPAANRRATVGYYDGHYGHVNVFTGKVPQSGELVIEQLTDRRTGNSPFGGQYQVKIDEQALGSFDFTNDGPKQQFTFRLVPGVGDLAPDVNLLNIATDKNIRLTDLRGKVVFLEFWATWCGPCQPAMQKLSELAGEQASAWRDRAMIIPVSIDDDADLLKKYVQQRNLGKLSHCWSGAEDFTGFKSQAARAFVVNGVPEALLIDAQGRILWRGNPMDSRDGQTLKSRIDAAIAK
jgi:thiol-disulfide isomerase/thioredoxin